MSFGTPQFSNTSQLSNQGPHQFSSLAFSSFMGLIRLLLVTKVVVFLSCLLVVLPFLDPDQHTFLLVMTIKSFVNFATKWDMRLLHVMFKMVLKSFSSMTLTEPSESPWHPHSSATAYRSPNSSNLSSLASYSGSNKIVVGDGTLLPIAHLSFVS
ncbi:hypothetical protein ACH5RR_026460 [Cinchona calisaya]|uniref:Uncharacterized protein n=1 Tax=Cinchona calisaya TaxID=153742 RepID=A0ABD2Z3Q7_9GENT